MGIITTLFGAEETPETRRVRLRRVHLTFQNETVRENFPAYLSTTRYTDPAAVYQIFRDLRHETREEFIALHLDGKNKIICFDRVSVGSLNQAIVHPRELFKAAVASSAAAVILIHNHPSGDPTPSREDLAITKRLREAGEILGIKVLDHIIVGDETFTSFVNQGLL